MIRNLSVFMLILVSGVLVGCGDKLTEETAKQVLEKELLTRDEGRGFTRMVFDEGTEGYAYFQSLIADGAFLFDKEEEAPWDILARGEQKPIRVYLPKPDMANVFGRLEIKDVRISGKVSLKDIVNKDRKAELPMKTVCEVYVKIKEEAIKSIDGIFNDEKNGTAMVKFTVAEVGVSPYYEDLCPLMYPGKPEGTGQCALRKPRSTEIQMKKYDEGWNIDMNPY